MSKQDDLIVAIEAAIATATTGAGAMMPIDALAQAVRSSLESYVAQTEAQAGGPVLIAPSAGIKKIVEVLAGYIVEGVYSEPADLQWGAPTLYGLNRARVGLEAYIAEKIWQ